MRGFSRGNVRASGVYRLVLSEMCGLCFLYTFLHFLVQVICTLFCQFTDLALQFVTAISMRQWVLSFPYALRFLFASRPEIMGRVLGIVYRVLSTTTGPTPNRLEFQPMRGLYFLYSAHFFADASLYFNQIIFRTISYYVFCVWSRTSLYRLA